MGSNVKHQKTSAKADSADASLVNPTDWNASHDGAMEIINRDVAQDEVVNSSSEESVYSHSIPANTLGSDGGFRLTLGGDYFNNSGATRTLVIKVKLGATTVFTSNAFNLLAVATHRRGWHLEVLCMNASAAVQDWLTWLGISPAVTNSLKVMNIGAGSDSVTIGEGVGTSTEDTTGALTVDVTMQHSAAHASLSIRCEVALLELIPPV